ncbi:MAG: carbohydrate binding family 9 domain-containing protein [Gemmatimonadaceae bacterium]|nr:carbohydrate binding family 9 domain-containing protein [Gemmatimonadaceae bacterium]
MLSALLAITLAGTLGLPADTLPAAPPTPADAVYSGRAGQLEVKAPRVDSSTIIVDAQFDEADWSRSALLTGFTTYSPVDGRPAQDSTQVRLLHTSNAIYLAIRAWAPAGTVRATLAERDRINNDDWVAVHFDTFNDRRRAFVFAVNPLGVQADGMRSEQSAGPGVSRASLTAADLTQDFVWQSKGRVLEDGYQIEVRIPFKSMRFQMGGAQDWGLQVVRQTQRNGFQVTWAPTSRGRQSFGVQAGYLRGMRDMRRGLVLDATPVVTSRTSGAPDSTGSTAAWRYDTRHQAGADVRWGVTSNFTLNGTVNPDFSQVETDVGQIPGDPRFALFFPELRPFFVEGSEQFDAPNRLVYTRQIVKPVVAAKLTGKIPHTDIGLLSAVDAQEYSTDGATNPIFNILRVRRDIGDESTAGLLLTDRTEGAQYNRVGGVDARIQFRRVYSIEARLHGSQTRDTVSTLRGSMWEANAGRSGRSYGFRYGLQGISPDFQTRVGFVPRTDFVRGQVNQRWTRFGRRGGWWDQQQNFLTATTLWTWDGFRDAQVPLENIVSIDNTITIRGGWKIGVRPELQSIAFDPRRYDDLRVVQGGDTVTFTPGERHAIGTVELALTTPQWRYLGATLLYTGGRDPEFFETATVDRRSLDLAMDIRPSRQVRVGMLLRYQRYERVRDGTRFSEQVVPRLRLEYQFTRSLFLRFVGQLESRRRDALRAPASEAPLLQQDSLGTWQPIAAQQSLLARADWLVQYLPSPGTVVFFGYGNSLDASLSNRPGDLRRAADGFFLKVSYLFRAGVKRRDMSGPS